jgi:hypothetical protein
MKDHYLHCSIRKKPFLKTTLEEGFIEPRHAARSDETIRIRLFHCPGCSARHKGIEFRAIPPASHGKRLRFIPDLKDRSFPRMMRFDVTHVCCAQKSEMALYGSLCGGFILRIEQAAVFHGKDADNPERRFTWKENKILFCKGRSQLK